MSNFAEEEEEPQSSIKVTSVGTDILRDILNEFETRISLTGASKVLTTNLKFASEVSRPFHESGTSYIPAITVATNTDTPDKEPAHGKINLQPLNTIQEKFYSHVLAHVNSDDHTQVRRDFRFLHWALQPKGIAVVICPKKDSTVEIVNASIARKLQQNGNEQDATVINGNEAEKALTKDGILKDLLERAAFEPGRIRVLERRHLTQGDEVEKAKVKMKAELERTLGVDETGKGWSKAFENAFWSETKQYGGLMLEAQVLIAQRWDELYA
ncbi:Hypothetical protein R9X50_00598100 [Acrodontium crateriforme]|uniref:Uncharacterized protein n=1 Tax=Acrodontium crateriforme TaxID=150365 RepID=A0AAQ3RBC2_9PEZI|nr:Hypothetical protein R9X50_00598100 [Acrodontium crateriforme]